VSKSAQPTTNAPVLVRGSLETRSRARPSARLLAGVALVLGCMALLPGSAFAFSFPLISEIGSTVPLNGDVNPYGLVTVPASAGSLVRGDLLVSNFNNVKNLQGTGTTIVQITPAGNQSLFAQINPATLPGPCPGGVGLTTALDVLPDGYVVVGSLPTENGEAATAQAGCLIVLNPSGDVVQTISGPPINGPWDMTELSAGASSVLFVTNVLNETVAHGETPTDGGTVVRIDLNTGSGHPPVVTSEKVIATGFPEATNEAALVVGPTGVGLSPDDRLYVADTLNDRIAAVPFALYRQTPIGGGGETVTTGGYLSSPLGLAIAPNGDIVTANGGNGDLVETTPSGFQFPPVNTEAEEGGLFGLTFSTQTRGIYFVDDSNNTLQLLH
jgi:hypothetical protein